MNHPTTPPLELLTRAEGERLLLLAPRPGRLSGALAAGSILTGGQRAGRLESLGRGFALVVPAGIEGRHLGPSAEWVRQPVERGSVLYTLEPLKAEAVSARSKGAAETTGATPGELAVLAPHAGRYWGRPAPDQPPFVSPGDVLEAGRPVGLIEVMKTFSQVLYRPGGPLPARARVRAVLVGDGQEIDERTALIALEALDS